MEYLTNETKNIIQKQIQKLNLKKFIIKEILEIITTLNYYKLQNLQSNIEEFLKFLLDLNKNYKKEAKINKVNAKTKTLLLINLVILEFTMSPKRIKNGFSKILK